MFFLVWLAPLAALIAVAYLVLDFNLVGLLWLATAWVVGVIVGAIDSERQGPL